MSIKCPCCDHRYDLIFYSKIPIGLYEERGLGDAIITENTDVCCLNCYWQGRLIDLQSDEEIGIIQTAKNRTKGLRLKRADE